ncbi:hypothetical protein N7481_006339 [Penicillium waksmanii]|uniref:uncharacterized protein n=1 Tax=Penicillium waksmanii TaxID=69791 RepID=UPI002547AE52|nr:uncharacterized protein N7481_006339 [Penicillium waksmanii]KAJ5984240.1 hypothetical protein N7481_006339 [Penicillium waksmanii]
MDRHVRLDIHVPPILSYSDPKDPQLTLTFNLIDSATPVTLVRLDAGLVPIVNCLTISEADTGIIPQLPTVDTYRKGSPGTTNQEDMDRLLTLHPDIPYVMSQSFRPLGHEKFTPEDTGAMSEDKYRFWRFGMHLLKTGQPYRLNVIEGLGTYAWMEGDKTNLFGKPWENSPVKIPILPGQGMEFRIEDVI